MADIAVFGAGGRAGRAVLAEARVRGHRVTAVVRDPGRHPGLAGEGVLVRVGDLTDPSGVAEAVRGQDAVVHVVTPYTGPPEDGFAGLDPEYFARAVDALVAGMTAGGVARLLTVGLFANLQTPDGRPLRENPEVLPPLFLPFALAHQRGTDALRTRGEALDWLELIPPTLLDAEGPRTGRYRLDGITVPDATPAHLSYADLAVALVDEIDTPRHHRAVLAVRDADGAAGA